MNSREATVAITQLVADGWLRGVQVFGTDGCCEHGPETDIECPSSGYGLMDRQCSWSDCNRAEPFIMRPHDKLMNPELKELLADHGWADTRHASEPGS